MNTQHDITVSGKPLNPPKPPAKPHMLLWIDTETTGLDPNQCELLEVGMQVTDLKAETRGDSLHLIVHPDNVRNWANHPEMLKAYEMHLANGLMLACAEAPKTGYDYKHTALNIHEFLNDQLSQYTLHPAGTNVDFDLRQLDVHLSRHLEHPITQGLHHRKLDLTSFRLADQAIGGNPYQNHAGTHRVQDCIRRDINDYTAYLDIIRTGTQGHNDALALAIRIEQSINATQPTAGEIERLAINLWEHNGERPTVYESGKRIADRELEWWKQVAVSAWSFINGTEKEQ